MTAVLDQPPLFAGAGLHAVTVERELTTYAVDVAGQFTPRTAEWFRWSCTCGENSGESLSSHWDLALLTGEGHICRGVTA